LIDGQFGPFLENRVVALCVGTSREWIKVSILLVVVVVVVVVVVGLASLGCIGSQVNVLTTLGHLDDDDYVTRETGILSVGER
jgi:hypothetical protein